MFGGEVGMQGRWQNGISMRLTYSYTKERLPKDKDGNTINNQYIPARAHSLNANVDYDHQSRSATAYTLRSTDACFRARRM